MKTFSVNALAEMLEKDRGLIVRSLRGIALDVTEKNQPRYRLTTALRALEMHQGIGSACSGASDEGQRVMDEMWAAFDVKFEAVKAAPTLAKRRKLALALAPEVASCQRAFIEHGRAIGTDAELLGLKADRIYQLMLIGFKEPCSWTLDECWSQMGAAMPSAMEGD